MKWNKVQVMVHGVAIANTKNGFSVKYPGVTLVRVHKVENPNYVFLDLEITAVTSPGIIKINVTGKGIPLLLSLN